MDFRTAAEAQHSTGIAHIGHTPAKRSAVTQRGPYLPGHPLQPPFARSARSGWDAGKCRSEPHGGDERRQSLSHARRAVDPGWRGVRDAPAAAPGGGHHPGERSADQPGAAVDPAGAHLDSRDGGDRRGAHRLGAHWALEYQRVGILNVRHSRADRFHRLGPGAGFTLVELMVVLLVLVMLATIAAPRVTKYLRKAKQQTAKVQV